MKPNIEIEYRGLPAEFFEEFESSLAKLPIKTEIKRDEEECYYFDGGPSDVIIYIDQHLTDLIVNGLVLPSIFAAFGYSLKSLWKKVKGFYQKENSLSGKSYISLSFKFSDEEEVEFSLGGDVNEKTINDLTDKIFEYLKNKDQLKKDFQNKNHKADFDLKPKIRMRYNPDLNKWEPVNFTEQKKRVNKQIQDFIRDMDWRLP